jgi:hypothetical protein
MKLKIFFANFQILGPLGCQGWVVIPQNVKKVKITAPYCTALVELGLWCYMGVNWDLKDEIDRYRPCLLSATLDSTVLAKLFHLTSLFLTVKDLRLYSKKNMVYIWDPIPELTTTHTLSHS